VTAGERAVGLGDLIRSAAKNLVDDIQRNLIGGHCHDIHRGNGLPAHGVNVREGVGRCDLPEEIRVIHDGREKIESLNQREVIINPIHGGIVGACRTDEEIGIRDVVKATQDLREFGLAELRGSSSAGGQFCQAFNVFATHRATIAYEWDFKIPFPFLSRVL
jgi:hypothetical protein